MWVIGIRELTELAMEKPRAGAVFGLLFTIGFGIVAGWAYSRYRAAPEEPLIVSIQEADELADRPDGYVTFSDAHWNCDAPVSLDGSTYVSLGQTPAGSIVVAMVSGSCLERAGRSAGFLGRANPKLAANLLDMQAEDPALPTLLLLNEDTPTILLILAIFCALFAAIGVWLTLWSLRKIRPRAT